MEHILFEGKKLFAAKDVAKYFNIDNSALNAWLRIHDDFRENQEYIIELGGGKKPRRFFTDLGITAYGTIKDHSRGNQHSERKVLSSLSQQPKAKVAESAHMLTEVHTDPVMAQIKILALMREQQLADHEQIQLHEEKIAQIEATSQLLIEAQQKRDEPGYEKMTKGQRDTINDFVRRLSIQTKIPFQVIWSNMHKYTGVNKLEHYTHADYRRGVQFIKNEYARYDIEY